MLLKTLCQMDKIQPMCWKCGSEITQETVSRADLCPVCKTDLHSCLNCAYHDGGSYHECREAVEDGVSDKEKSNFCDSFKVRRSFPSAGGHEKKSLDARKAFDALFS